LEITKNINEEKYEEIYKACCLLGEKIYSMHRLEIEEKVEEFCEFIKKEKRLPKTGELFSDNTNMYNWWRDVKRDGRLEKEPYNKLLENEIAKEDYQKYKSNKNK
jgi:hypothetical protein